MLKEGRLAKIEYIPKKNINVKQIDTAKLKSVFDVEASDKITNIFYKNKLIHRFNSPIEDVEYSISDDLNSGLIYSKSLQQAYRVDLKKGSSRLEKVSEKFNSVSLLDLGKVIIETDDGFLSKKIM